MSRNSPTKIRGSAMIYNSDRGGTATKPSDAERPNKQSTDVRSGSVSSTPKPDKAIKVKPTVKLEVIDGRLVVVAA